MRIEPDTKDWTWVLERRCEQCGLDTTTVDVARLPDLLRENTRGWSRALAGADVTVRPAPGVWSPVEYACHVRDVHRLFEERLSAMLSQDDPAFPSWDQDAVAEEQRYDEQDPATVEVELIEAAATVAGRYAMVTGPQWQRSGRRSDGWAFTVETLGRYHLHDAAHHLHDVLS